MYNLKGSTIIARLIRILTTSAIVSISSTAFSKNLRPNVRILNNCEFVITAVLRLDGEFTRQLRPCQPLSELGSGGTNHMPPHVLATHITLTLLQFATAGVEDARASKRSVRGAQGIGEATSRIPPTSNLGESESCAGNLSS